MRSFVALAEDLHFSSAAARLGIAQPTLTMHLQQLERSLGARLVERSSRRVELTDAGRRLLAEAAGALALLAEAANTVRSGPRSSPRPRVGSTTGARAGIIGPILDRYDLIAPWAPVALREEASGSLLRELAAGRIDLCIMYCAGDVPAGLQRERLAEFPAFVAVPATDSLAGRASVRVTELGHLPLVLVADEDSEGFNAIARSACHAAGIAPEPAWIPRGGTTSALASTDGFMFVPDTSRPILPDGYTMAAVEPPSVLLYFDLRWHRARARTPIRKADQS